MDIFSVTCKARGLKGIPLLYIIVSRVYYIMNSAFTYMESILDHTHIFTASARVQEDCSSQEVQ